MSVQNNGLHSDILSSHGYSEALEDIEHPAWISTTSFSESCGSHFSRLSSLKDNCSPEALDARVVPDHCEKLSFKEAGSAFPSSEHSVHSEEGTNNRIGLRDNHGDNENHVPYTVSGSLQSLSSSSKTVYASPRSNSESHFHCQLSKSHLSERAKQRRGNLYRERAPSENALDFSNLKIVRESKLSHSLYDVSSIPSNGLKNPSQRPRNTRASLSALCSRNRSRDSGFTHSGSLISLNSSSHKYDHVESKVKRYIQNIKDADSLRKKERAMSKPFLAEVRRPASEDDFAEPQDGPELVHLVHKMQHDMAEKDRILHQLQDDYYNLLQKYAEAENKIDKLRLGWYERGSPSGQGNPTSDQKGQPSNRSVYRKFKESLVEIDDSSLTSSMFLSHFDSAVSPNSSFHVEDGGQKNISHIGKGKKEVICSAPLRPISSLYCTSLRLDRIVAPLTSKSSSSHLGELSTASSRGLNSTASNYKTKKDMLDGLPDATIREGTTDTGIDSFCPFSTEGLHMPSIGHLPHEDPIVKVQRWQKSLPTPSRPGDEFSPCSKSTSLNRTRIPDHSFELMHRHDKISVHAGKPKVASIGIQVNGCDVSELPSISSGMSTSMVPCLNLGELSGCTEDPSGSAFCSESERNKSVSKQESTKLDSSSAPEFECSLPSKSFSSNLEISASTKHRRWCRFNHGGKSLCHLSGSDLAKIISMVWKDQDHVVPASPEKDMSLHNAFKMLKHKLGALKSSVNLQTFVSLLDVLIELVPMMDCSCHDDQSVPSDITKLENSSTHPEPDSSVVPSCSDAGCSLLQCLEEVDDLTHQLWAKTESFLEVLNGSNSRASPKPK